MRQKKFVNNTGLKTIFMDAANLRMWSAEVADTGTVYKCILTH